MFFRSVIREMYSLGVGSLWVVFMLSFFTPTFIGLTLGAYCAQRHGLDKAIIALGTAGIALIGIALLGMIDLLFSPLG